LKNRKQSLLDKSTLP